MRESDNLNIYCFKYNLNLNRVNHIIIIKILSFSYHSKKKKFQLSII